MTTVSDEGADVIALPQRPSADSNAQSAPARSREDEHPSPKRLSVITRLAPSVVSGGSLWTAQPPSLAEIWARHCASAHYYRAPALRGIRYLFGVIHLTSATVNYFLAWVNHSIPLILLFLGLAALAFWLL